MTEPTVQEMDEPLAGKLGRLPALPEDVAPRLKLTRFLALAALPEIPTTVDWLSKVASWPMYGNADWGCCVESMAAHVVEAVTTYGQGATVKVTDADVLKMYSDVTGFNPNAGPPGRNPTDQGTVTQQALSYWRKTGIAGHKILAFAQVDHTNPAEVLAALHLFGHVMVGVDFPASGMTQFNRRQIWDVVAHDGGSEGGHAIHVGYDATADRLRAVSWARVQDMTPAWWERYTREAWVAVAPEWVDANGHTPAGLDLYGLGAALETLTHGKTKNPFPPPVTPPPPPVTEPPALQREKDMAAALGPWLAKPHAGSLAPVAAALKTELKRAGLL